MNWTMIKKNRRFEESSTLLLRNKNDPFLKRIVMPEKLHNISRSRNYTKKGHGDCLVVCGRSHPSQLLDPGETITAEKYCRQIDEMHQKLQRMCPTLVNMKGPILFHDNARPHVAQLTLLKQNEMGYETLPHPPYSPDLSPTDYHFYKHLDNFLREKCFKSRDDAESAFNDFIASRTPDFYFFSLAKMCRF